MLKQLNKNGNGNERLELGAVLILLSIIVLAAWWSLDHIKETTKADLQKKLNSTLNAVQSNLLEHWATQKNIVDVWAQNGQMQETFMALAQLPSDKKLLTQSPYQKQLRKWMLPSLKTLGYEGYYLIGNDFSNLAATHDNDIGELSLLSEQDDFLDRVWQEKRSLACHKKRKLFSPRKMAQVLRMKESCFSLHRSEVQVTLSLPSLLLN